MSNNIVIADRELVGGSIEGVDFGPKLWVIARSPTTVLAWVYGHSASINGFTSYYQPHLLILPDRTPSFIYNPRYKSLRHEWTRLNSTNIEGFRNELIMAFGIEALPQIFFAVEKRRTVIIDGGGGSLKPLNCYGDDFREWKARGGGFIVYPDGMTEHDSYRHKLGWKPKEK